MADQSDVEASLVAMIGATLYPSGAPAQDPPQPSVVGKPARIYRGWPNGLQLDKDLAAGIFNVSVYAPPGYDRNVSRFPNDWQFTAPSDLTFAAGGVTFGGVQFTSTSTTLTTAVAVDTVMIGGTVTTPQNVAVKVRKKGYVYSLQAQDTLASIASALAALIAVDYPGTAANGPVITVADTTGQLSAAVGGYASAWRELRRQQKQFQICFWCPDPDTRDKAVSLVDAALAGIERFTLPDDSVARMIYARSTSNDAPQKEKLYRRDLFYMVEYPTTQTASFAQIVDFETTISPTPPT